MLYKIEFPWENININEKKNIGTLMLLQLVVKYQEEYYLKWKRNIFFSLADSPKAASRMSSKEKFWPVFDPVFNKKSGNELFFKSLPDSGRDDLTRTDDPYVPNVVR